MQFKDKLMGHRTKSHAESGKAGVCWGWTSSSFMVMLLWFLLAIPSDRNSAHLPTLLFHTLPHALAEAKVALCFSLPSLEPRMQPRVKSAVSLPLAS